MKKMRMVLSVLLVLIMAFSAVPMNALADLPPEPKNGWSEDGDYYYENDVAAKGFKKIGDWTYYFDTETGKKTKGLKTINAKKYYFNESGIMLTGFHTVNGDTYYFNKPDGASVMGLKKIGNDYYFFDGSYRRRTGWKNSNAKRYYFDPSTAKAVKGFKKIGSSYYFFDSNAQMVTGWKKIKKNKYFFYKSGDKKGKAATGVVKIEGKKYKFKKNGQLEYAYNKMDNKADGLSSPTKYLILVDRKIHKVGIYKGKKGNWKRIKYFSCTTGKPSTPTITGTFLLGTRQQPWHKRYFDSADCRVWWATRITSGYYFHSILYFQTSKPNRVMNSRLGKNLSHGCIRLATKNAKWIYDNIPKRTKCVIY
ncbi:MAG: L,D-transpeptidase family protein [Eubacterium sp.]|nr:L,D-transpeptidase family protein [Eubacterium sp.]